MIRRTAEAAKRIRLLKLLEENNSKSPDILTVVVEAKSTMEAWQTTVIFEEVTGDDLPVNLDEWRKLVRPPVELYFIFKRKTDLNRFIKRLGKEGIGIEPG